MVTRFKTTLTTRVAGKLSRIEQGNGTLLSISVNEKQNLVSTRGKFKPESSLTSELKF